MVHACLRDIFHVAGSESQAHVIHKPQPKIKCQTASVTACILTVEATSLFAYIAIFHNNERMMRRDVELLS